MFIDEDKDVLIIEQPCWSVARFHREQIKSVAFQVYGDPLGFSVLSCLSIQTWQGQSVTIIPDSSEILKTVKNSRAVYTRPWVFLDFFIHELSLEDQEKYLNIIIKINERMQQIHDDIISNKVQKIVINDSDYLHMICRDSNGLRDNEIEE